MKIALAQINTTVGDFYGNVERILRFARNAAERGADLVVFPELALCGYPPRDLVEKPGFVERCESALTRLAQALPPVPAIVGYVRRSGAQQGKPVADAAALLADGKVQLDYNKILLPYYDVFDETRYFEPGTSPAVYELAGARVGLTICEDAWNDKNFWKRRLYRRDPVEESVRAGANVIINIAASPFTRGKIRLREAMLSSIARERGAPVVYVNLVGGNDSLIFDGSSVALNACGEICARALAFEEDLVLFDTTSGEGERRPGPPCEMAAVARALELGTRDYVLKCGFKKALVGLSGGIDSSLVAALATRALGAANVCGVSMPGPYSSGGSRRDAEELARNLGIDFRVIPISPVVDAYLQTLNPAFAGLAPDATEENIQARIRGNILMALSNKFGALVLSTGNKSELAVGYCTLYGDMAGGLAMIADVPKTMVYELARFINGGDEGVGPIPEACFTKPPSAELRPDQTDQDTLPPYTILDAILGAYIEENLSPQAIAARLGCPEELVRATVACVRNAEYKRQQAAPVLKVTEKAFGIGRRYPIANRFEE